MAPGRGGRVLVWGEGARHVLGQSGVRSLNPSVVWGVGEGGRIVGGIAIGEEGNWD